jgi:hypothetical protein
MSETLEALEALCRSRDTVRDCPAADAACLAAIQTTYNAIKDRVANIFLVEADDVPESLR